MIISKNGLAVCSILWGNEKRRNLCGFVPIILHIAEAKWFFLMDKFVPFIVLTIEFSPLRTELSEKGTWISICMASSGCFVFIYSNDMETLASQPQPCGSVYIGSPSVLNFAGALSVVFCAIVFHFSILIFGYCEYYGWLLWYLRSIDHQLLWTGLQWFFSRRCWRWLRIPTCQFLFLSVM